MRYCPDVCKTVRWLTREVPVGKIVIGGENPVRIQSMTTSPTQDIESTAMQVIRLADLGCEMVRVTVQGKREAAACEGIKNLLIQRGYDIPLIADIHFYPPAAMQVVDFVDKVRINPGNFIDKRATFKVVEYDEASYAIELERIEEKFSPLIEKCKKLGCAMRIGANQGSLSDRIMNRYGDTPAGMVESAFEFARVCRSLDYHQFLFSMKSSNPQVMIEAYRLLVARMMEVGWNYPLHLGVTEAGEGEDGRIKSAVGIGALLLDGLGDTIRISLTEDPWEEVDPCRRLIQFAQGRLDLGTVPFEEKRWPPSSIIKPKFPPQLHQDGAVLMQVTDEDIGRSTFFEEMGYRMELGILKRGIESVDGIVYLPRGPQIELPTPLQKLADIGVTILTHAPSIKGTLPIVPLQESPPLSPFVCRVRPADSWDKLASIHPEWIFFAPEKSVLHEVRHFCAWAKKVDFNAPIILELAYECPFQDLIIQAAAECGAILADRLVVGLFLTGAYPAKELRSYQLNLLQAVRMRSSKTDFISCPGCGRTLFDLQETSKRIRDKTAHLPGVKIAIMGCVVNGPGEMADADFGYVGSLPGLVDLYMGKQCIEKGIPFGEADERLIDLIKSHGRWVEPSVII